ncbi:unnamed protein product [Linum tenue]|uniref:F-box domain-containing protein n=1 Tax=Linum tenue TaxID=586396 RepID=A0AAV0QMP4_9ROSI|nr:unnamed protein product [Linum tenue]
MSSYGHGDRELHHGLPFAANPTKRRRISSDGNPPPPPISKLGDDLLVEILIRGLLNPRFACRSKLVCKQWSSLISSSCFNRRFVARHQSKEETPPSISGFLPVPGEVRRSLWVLDSFEDLLLCGFAGFDRNTNGELGLSYLICNPFTKQWIALPLAPEKSFEQCPEVVARLVCEPRISKNLDLGDGQAAFVYSEYRFRVVCIYTLGMSTMLDVFCSESGEWTKKALVLHGYQEEVRLKPKSCHGKLFWAYAALLHVGIVEFNPFHFDIPPVFIHDDSIFERPAKSWGFSVSHGALHLIQLETETTPGCSRNALIVWRLEDDRRSWKRQHEVLLKTMWHGDVPCNIEFDLHPENPETALLILGHYSGRIFSCDLRSGELEQLITTRRAYERGWMLFRHRFSCWPTPIPSYKELRGLYDGSYSCWVQQSSDEAKTPSATGNYFY